MLNVFTGQVSKSVRSGVFALVPAPTVTQYAAAAAEYFPLVHSAHAVMVPPAPYFPAPQSAHARLLVVVQSAVWYRPAAHVKQLEHAACLEETVKKPAAQAVHDVAPPTENVPATQLEQALSADAVPCDEMCVPAAQYVWVIHDEATTSEYFPLAQLVHSSVAPALYVPAGHIVEPAWSGFALYPATTKVQCDAPIREYVPAVVQRAHPESEYEPDDDDVNDPAAQSEHSVSEVVVHCEVANLPGVHIKQLWQVAFAVVG